MPEPNVSAIHLESSDLLARYACDGHYTDCFESRTRKKITLEQFVAAFYTTRLFRLERWILTLALRRRITDDHLTQLAAGTSDTFAAWHVEARQPTQLLLADNFGRTRSWLQVESDLEDGGTVLRFGSAVMATNGQLSPLVRMTIQPHRWYSRGLLRAAVKRL